MIKPPDSLVAQVVFATSGRIIQDFRFFGLDGGFLKKYEHSHNTFIDIVSRMVV